MKRRIIIGVSALVGVLLIAVVAFIFLAGRTSASSLDDAISDLRAEAQVAQSLKPGLPRQGVYELAVTGSEAISGGPVTVTRGLPDRAPMIVRHTDDGYETEFRYSSDHTEWVRYRLAGEGASATWGQSEIGAAGVSTKRPRAWSPAPLRLPAAPKVGDTWQGDYKSGELEVRIESRVDREDTVTVGGQPVPVVVIESTQTVAGEYSGSRSEQFFYSPKHGLVVRYVIESDLEGPVSFRYDADQTVMSLQPAV